MAEIIMPKVGDAMSEGKVVRWYKKAGDAVKRGEPVLEIETDKVNLDLEAEADGTLGDLKAEEGQMVPVGEVVARILAEGEKEAPAEKPAEKKPAEKPAEQTAEEKPADDPQQRRGTDKKDSVKHTTGEYAEAIEHKGLRRDKTRDVAESTEATQPSDRRRSSPLARKMAQELGVSLEDVQGSGPRGRIVADDVKNAQGKGTQQPAAAAAPEPAAPQQQKQGAPQQQRSIQAPQSAGASTLQQTQIPLSAMRRTIAKRLAESTGPIPHFYLTADYDVTQLMAARQQLLEITSAKISLNDFIIRAVALALRQHPFVNASWGDEAITQHGEIHVGVAVATSEGLITPVIRNADEKSVLDIAIEVRALAEKAKNRRLKPEEYQGSTFTISNLGAWGIEEFTAIINPPNAAILAIGTAEARPIVDANRQIIIRDRMKVTMSCDHRIIDGAVGAEYLKTLRQYIEQPLRLLV
ncbi:MAG TPA: dihydrolipoamide acetyltransferase family protein [Thermoanaerobaculia bacterium]